MLIWIWTLLKIMYIFFYGLVYWSVERFKMLEMYDLHEDEAGGAMTSFFL